jgi:hypothetical protein
MKIKQRLLVFYSNALVIGTVKTPNNTNSQLDQRSETATRATGKIRIQHVTKFSARIDPQIHHRAYDNSLQNPIFETVYLLMTYLTTLISSSACHDY